MMPNGLYAAMPRDLFLVVGETIIEAPTAWRSRYFDALPFRTLLLEYFMSGARWVAAPKPRLADELYRDLHLPGTSPAELEPTFDAADFVRCGRDLLVQRSKVTNGLGIEWVRRELGSGYTIHEIPVHDDHAMHLDATLVPLAPGVALVNPERLPVVPAALRHWKLIDAPRPVPRSRSLLMSSDWISINVLMLDEKRAVVDLAEQPLIECLRRNGFETIATSLNAFNAFGGSFHCATLDIRREGELESYCG
jgi:glycine amidinotransferase